MQAKKHSKTKVQQSSTSQSKPRDTKSQTSVKIEEPLSPLYSNFLGRLQIQNVVSTVNLNTKLNLKQIALQAWNAEYNPRRFASVIMRLKEPKSTALIFSSGKMVCTGSKDEVISKVAMRKFARILQKLGYPVQFGKFEVQNIVGSCDTGMTLDLDQIVYKHNQFTNYEPEIFPGLVYWMLDPKIVLLIFVSGKIVLTGAKRKEDIECAFRKIIPVLIEVQKKPLKI